MWNVNSCIKGGLKHPYSALCKKTWTTIKTKMSFSQQKIIIIILRPLQSGTRSKRLRAFPKCETFPFLIEFIFLRLLRAIYWKWETWSLWQMSIRLAPLSLGKRLLRLSAQLSIRRPLLLLSALRLPLHCFKCPRHLAACLPACLPAWQLQLTRGSGWMAANQRFQPLSQFPVPTWPASSLMNPIQGFGGQGVWSATYYMGKGSGTVLPVLPSTWLLCSHTSIVPFPICTRFWETPKATHFSALASRLKPWSVFADLCSWH